MKREFWFLGKPEQSGFIPRNMKQVIFPNVYKCPLLLRQILKFCIKALHGLFWKSWRHSIVCICRSWLNNWQFLQTTHVSLSIWVCRQSWGIYISDASFLSDLSAWWSCTKSGLSPVSHKIRIKLCLIPPPELTAGFIVLKSLPPLWCNSHFNASSSQPPLPPSHPHHTLPQCFQDK